MQVHEFLQIIFHCVSPVLSRSSHPSLCSVRLPIHDLFRKSIIIHPRDVCSLLDNKILISAELSSPWLPRFGLWLSRRCLVSVAEISDVLLPTFSSVWQTEASFALQSIFDRTSDSYSLTFCSKLMCSFFHTGLNLPNTLLASPILIWLSLLQLLLSQSCLDIKNLQPSRLLRLLF